MENLPPIIATINNKVVGFAEFEGNGHIDCFYCHHEYQGCGAGSALMKEIENRARALKIKKFLLRLVLRQNHFLKERGL